MTDVRVSNEALPVASSSSSPAAAEELPRPEAGPLPKKRGEIGYSEEVHGRAMAMMDAHIASERQQVAMGERHPADSPPEANPSGGAPTNASVNTLTSTAPSGAPPPAHDNASMSSSARLQKFKKLRGRHVGGVTVWTLARLIASLFVLAGTGVGWAFAVIALQKSSSNSNPSDVSSGFSGTNSEIFVHVAFGIVALAQLVLLERQIFRVRAERYAFKHPGEMLRRGGPMSAAIPMAPWQRPSLPTYAAALAQSGVRTGDVEDGLIAQPPPPAYGKTRGSTLVLRGFLNNEHFARARVFDEEAQIAADGTPIDPPSRRGSAGSVVFVQHPDRPVSYRTHDPEWETFMDAQRARAVEQALAAMEDVPPAHISDRDRP